MQSLTHKSPQDPEAILSPIFNSFRSISQFPPDFASTASAFSTAD